MVGDDRRLAPIDWEPQLAFERQDEVVHEGDDLRSDCRAAAEELGVFGVPSYVVDDELFWGREHLSMVRLRLAEQGLAKPGVEVDVPHALR